MCSNDLRLSLPPGLYFSDWLNVAGWTLLRTYVLALFSTGTFLYTGYDVTGAVLSLNWFWLPVRKFDSSLVCEPGSRRTGNFFRSTSLQLHWPNIQVTPYLPCLDWLNSSMSSSHSSYENLWLVLWLLLIPSLCLHFDSLCCCCNCRFCVPGLTTPCWPICRSSLHYVVQLIGCAPLLRLSCNFLVLGSIIHLQYLC